MALQKVQSQSITLDDPITSRKKHGIKKLAANRTKCDHKPGKKAVNICHNIHHITCKIVTQTKFHAVFSSAHQ